MSRTLCPNFQECVALEELYLSHNGIAKMEGLSTLVNLRVLDVSSNKLTAVNDIENLPQYGFSSSQSTSSVLKLNVDLLPDNSMQTGGSMA